MVRRAFAAPSARTRNQTRRRQRAPHSRLLSLLPFCPSCEKISLVRGDLHPPQQPLRFELHFGSQDVRNPEGLLRGSPCVLQARRDFAAL